MSSVQPISVPFKFQLNAKQATDMVDLAALDAVNAQIAAKLNEIRDVLNVNTRDDDTFKDEIIDSGMLSLDTLEAISAQAFAKTQQ
jgi:hypothetical protein